MAIPGDVGPDCLPCESDQRSVRDSKEKRKERRTHPTNLEPAVVQRDTLEACCLVEGESAVRVDEGDEADVLVGDVADLLKDAAADDVADLLRRDFGVDVLRREDESAEEGKRLKEEGRRTPR